MGLFGNSFFDNVEHFVLDSSCLGLLDNLGHFFLLMSHLFHSVGDLFLHGSNFNLVTRLHNGLHYFDSSDDDSSNNNNSSECDSDHSLHSDQFFLDNLFLLMALMFDNNNV